MILLRALARLALIYAGVLILGFLAYIGLIRTPLLADVEILFYRGVLVAAILALLLIMAGIGALRWLRLEPATLVGSVALSLAFNISFLIVFPVTYANIWATCGRSTGASPNRRSRAISRSGTDISASPRRAAACCKAHASSVTGSTRIRAL